MEYVHQAIADANVDLTEHTFTEDDVLRGMKVEYEHGSWGTAEGLPAGVDVIGNNQTAAAKIALAHLLETRDGQPQYDYYDGLEIIESSPAGIWRNRADYWQHARFAVVILIIILLIVMMSSASALAKLSVVVGIGTVLYLKGDTRMYLV